MSAVGDTNGDDFVGRKGPRYSFTRGFTTILVSTAILVIFCLVFAPSSLSSGALQGSLPFAAVIAMVGLAQLLVVQQGGVDLSVAGSVSLAVVISVHIPLGDSSLLPRAIAIALGCAVLAGIANGLLIGFLKVNAIVATIGMNALLYGAVFAFSGGVPSITTPLLQQIAGGETFGLPNSIWFAIATLAVVSLLLKKTVAGRRFEFSGANRHAARIVGLRVQLHEMSAYLYAQLIYCLAGITLAGVIREPTAFQGDSLLLPSIAVVVLGGTSLLGGRGYPVSTCLAAFFLNQLGQFALALGIPYSGQTIIQAFALGLGIGVYSVNWTETGRKLATLLGRKT